MLRNSNISLRLILNTVIGIVLLGILAVITANVIGKPDELHKYGLLGLVALIAVIAVLSLPEQSTQPEETQEQRNRRRMLEKVRTIWIHGLLEKSLYQTVRIELGLAEKQDAVAHPWTMIQRQPGVEDQILPPDTLIVDVYDHLANGELLILGEPGSGKTTMLLELLRDLLNRVEEKQRSGSDTAESLEPIPVMFNLSGWGKDRPKIADWLVTELRQRYFVPKKIAQDWVDRDQILPLLDGLDEVAAERRDACVAAINAFREQHGQMSLVVCSRIADYAALKSKLRLQSAVVIQPLTPTQIHAALDRAGPALAGVKAAVEQDSELMELLETPLMLSIVALAYRDYSVEEIRRITGLENQRRYLFEAYTVAMLTRRSNHRRYRHEQTLHWLTWLAQQMREQAQNVFYLEKLQPYWLPGWQHRLVYSLFFGLFVGLVGGLVGWLVGWLFVGLAVWPFVGLFFGLVGWLFFGLFVGLFVGLFFGLVGGLFVGLVGGLVESFKDTGEIIERSIPNEGVRRAAKNGLFFGLFVGLVVGLFFGLVVGLFVGLVVGLFFGLFVGLFFGLWLGYSKVLKHYTLRFTLWLSRLAPLNYVAFLDHAAEMILLRKVGGGYIFIHRTLLEWFAELTDQEIQHLSQQARQRLDESSAKN